MKKRAQETETEKTMIILLSVRFNGALLKREGLRRNGCSVITKSNITKKCCVNTGIFTPIFTEILVIYRKHPTEESAETRATRMLISPSQNSGVATQRRGWKYAIHSHSKDLFDSDTKK
jgi:hypothetical protein